MDLKNLIIVIDSGFTREVVERVTNLVAFVDLNRQTKIVGTPFIEGEQREQVLASTNDILQHGTIVLEKLLAFQNDLHFILVSAFDHDERLIRTEWIDGEVSRDGWVDACLWAAELARGLGYSSVTNCSFGGFEHAMDGSGWEAFQLSRLPAGHLVVAAAGPGDGRAMHATVGLSCGAKTVCGYQQSTSSYNLLIDRRVPDFEQARTARANNQWQLVVNLNGSEVARHHGSFIAANLWNDRQQLKFTVEGEGDFEFVLSREHDDDEPLTRFDIFINRSGNAHFKNYVDSELVSEPACLPQVIAAGLEDGFYGHCTIAGLQKPEIRLSGAGPISFRTPEVTLALHNLLAINPRLTVSEARALLTQLKVLVNA